MLYGQKIQLRAVEREDLVQLRDWRNRPEFRRNFREFRELNMVNQEAWFTRMSNSPNDFMFVIERSADRKAVGAAGLVYVNWVLRSADLSLYIGADDAYVDGVDGHAADTARTLIRYAFDSLNLNKVWTELYAFDAAKVTLFEHLGFARDGVLRDNAFADGRYHDSFIYSLLRADNVKT